MKYSTNVVGYVRVSTDEQAADWKTSLAYQRTAIAARADQLGRRLDPERVFEDRFSGGTAEGRPAFMALVDYCRARPQPEAEPGFAVFLNDTRFGRFDDPDEAAYWRFELAKCGWIARFAEGDDTEDLIARHLLRAIGSAQASAYRQQIRRNARQGGRGAAEKGLWQTEAPFGYRRYAFGGGRAPEVLEPGIRKSEDQQVRLTPGPGDEVATVRWIFERYASGEATLSALARELRHRVPERRWSKQQVSRILNNRVYLGEVVWGRRRNDGPGHRRVRRRPREEWTITPDAHPALVDEALFARVQKRLEGNQRRTRATLGGYPLAGLIMCAQCGRHFTGGGGRLGPAEDRDRYRFYKCSGGTCIPPVCPGPIATISKRLLEPLVIGEIARLVSNPGVQELIAAEVARQLSAATADLDQGEAASRSAMAALERQRDNLVRAIADGVLQAEEAAGRMNELREELRAAQQQRLHWDTLRTAAAAGTAEQARLVALASDFAARARDLTGPALRELVIPWIQAAVFDKERRILRLEIRQIPNVGSLAALDAGPGPTSVREFQLQHPLSPYCRPAARAA